MFHVEKWYRNYQLKLDKKGGTLGNLTKRIFVATDEKSLLAKLKKELVFMQDYKRTVFFNFKHVFYIYSQVVIVNVIYLIK